MGTKLNGFTVSTIEEIRKDIHVQASLSIKVSIAVQKGSDTTQEFRMVFKVTVILCWVFFVDIRTVVEVK